MFLFLRRLQLQPVSHPASIIDYSDTKEFKLQFKTPHPVSLACALSRHEDNGKQEDCSEYTFKTQTKNGATFAMKFPKPGEEGDRVL